MRDADQYTPRLSAYLDGDLDPAEKENVERHLSECAACAATLEDLRAVVRRAKALQDQPPTRDLWGGVAQRIGSTTVTTQVSHPSWSQRRFSFSIPQLAAAGIALLLVAGGVAQWVRSDSLAPSESGLAVAPTGNGVPVVRASGEPLS